MDLNAPTDEAIGRASSSSLAISPFAGKARFIFRMPPPNL